MRRLFNQILPFIFLGIALVAFAFGLILLAYLLLIGALVGLLLFFAMWIRQWWLNHIMKNATNKKIHPRQEGEIIDPEDWKRHF